MFATLLHKSCILSTIFFLPNKNQIPSLSAPEPTTFVLSPTHEPLRYRDNPVTFLHTHTLKMFQSHDEYRVFQNDSWSFHMVSLSAFPEHFIQIWLLLFKLFCQQTEVNAGKNIISLAAVKGNCSLTSAPAGGSRPFFCSEKQFLCQSRCLRPEGYC